MSAVTVVRTDSKIDAEVVVDHDFAAVADDDDDDDDGGTDSDDDNDDVDDGDSDDDDDDSDVVDDNDDNDDDDLLSVELMDIQRMVSEVSSPPGLSSLQQKKLYELTDLCP